MGRHSWWWWCWFDRSGEEIYLLCILKLNSTLTNFVHCITNSLMELFFCFVEFLNVGEFGVGVGDGEGESAQADRAEF